MGEYHAEFYCTQDVDTVSRGPSMRELKLLHSNVNDDTGYAESGGMIQPLYK